MIDLVEIPTRYYPKRHMAPFPTKGYSSWQNDGQNYVWDRKEKVWRTWALGNPEWKPNELEFVKTGWISYKGKHLDTMEPDSSMFIDMGNGLSGTLWSGSCYVDWDNNLGRGEGYVYYYVSAPQPNLQGMQLLVAPKLGEVPYNIGMTIPPDGLPEEYRDGGRNFRDCRVFWDDENQQLVLSATCGSGFVFFVSQNGTEWSCTGGMEGPGPLVECPNLYQLPIYDRSGNWTGDYQWTILGAVQGFYDGGTDSNECCVAWIGDWNGKTFIPKSNTPQPLDYGPDSYATAAGEDDGGNSYVGFWIGNWSYCLEPLPYIGFQNIQSLPRKCWIQEQNNGELKVYNYLLDRDISNYEKIVTDSYQVIGGPRPVYKFSEDSSDPGFCYRLDVKLTKLNDNWPKKTLIKLCHGDLSGEEFYTSFSIDGDEGSVKLNRSNAGLDYPNSPNTIPFEWNREYTTPVDLDLLEKASIHLSFIVDSSSVEMFVDKGKYSLTSLIFPPEGCTGIDIDSSGEIGVQTTLFKFCKGECDYV